MWHNKLVNIDMFRMENITKNKFSMKEKACLGIAQKFGIT